MLFSAYQKLPFLVTSWPVIIVTVTYLNWFYHRLIPLVLILGQNPPEENEKHHVPSVHQEEPKMLLNLFTVTCVVEVSLSWRPPCTRSSSSVLYSIYTISGRRHNPCTSMLWAGNWIHPKRSQIYCTCTRHLHNSERVQDCSEVLDLVHKKTRYAYGQETSLRFRSLSSAEVLDTWKCWTNMKKPLHVARIPKSKRRIVQGTTWISIW